jgi:chromosome segregation ATPase
VLTPMKAQSTFSPLSSPTNTINTNLNSRLVHLSTANEIEQLVAQVTELNAYKDNQGIIHQQLRSEIHALQEELLQRSQESGILTKLQNDLENQVNINSQLKDRINILTKEKLSMDEVKLELISKDRQIHSLQSSLTNAEKEAVIQKEKGFEEAVKCMEQDMTDLQDQIKSNRRSVESEYKSVVNELRQQRDQFEKELLATSKLLKERSSNGQSNSNFHDAINSADKIVSSVQKQVAWHEEKRKLVEKIELLLQKEAMYEQNRNIVGEEMKEKTVSMSKQISKLEKELVQSNHKLQIVEKERLLLQEKLHKMEALQQDININEKGTETHYSLKESEKMRILENELSATKYELAATQKIMADAKQNISDLKWENTSLRHDIFMAKTSESAPLSRFGSSITKSNTDNSNNSISNKNDDSISRTPPKPTTLDNYVYNTKTLTQVLSNTKPLRIRLEAATAANQRSRLTRLARTTRTRVTPDKVLTPQIGVQDFNRSDMMVNNDEKIGMSAVNLHLSPSLNPLGYYQPNLEGDI